MMFIDSGPMVALVNRHEPNHEKAKKFMAGQPSGPATTVWPALTEAMYFLGKAGGIYAQDRLWVLLAAGRILLHTSSPAEVARMEALMRKYADLPMDLADAAIVAAVEVTGDRRVFSFDTDFHVYRLPDDSPLDVVP